MVRFARDRSAIADPVFIVGAPRSGTSLVHWLLAAHPELAYVDAPLARLWHRPTLHALERLGGSPARSRLLYRLAQGRGGAPAYEPALRFLELEPALPVEGLFLWHDRELPAAPGLRPADLREHPAAAARIRARYVAMARRAARRRMLDKSPSYTVMLDAIRELFPQADVVHVIRDGRAVVNSIVYGLKYRWQERGWWGPRPPDWQRLEEGGLVARASHQWVYLVEQARRGAELFPGRYHEIRYEQLVGAAQAGLLRLFERLGLAPFGHDLYPHALENRNHKWRAHEAASFGDRIWTDRAVISPSEYPELEPLRRLLEQLGYVEAGAPLAAAAHAPVAGTC